MLPSSEICNKKFLYVDKTAYIDGLADSDGKYFCYRQGY